MAVTDPDLADALDRTITDLINLGLVAKQARWNVVGRGADSLRVLLDNVADVARAAGDTVEERSTILGGNPDGRIDTVAENNPLPALHLGPLHDTDVISAFAEIFEIVLTRLFEGISAAGFDLVTQNLLVDVAGRLDQLAWIIRSSESR